MSDLMPPLVPAHALFGVPATVTPLGGSQVTTTVLRAAPRVSMGDLLMPAAAATAQRPQLSVPRADVPSLPVGSIIEADFGEGLRAYRVDRLDETYAPDEWRVLVS